MTACFQRMTTNNITALVSKLVPVSMLEKFVVQNETPTHCNFTIMLRDEASLTVGAVGPDGFGAAKGARVFLQEVITGHCSKRDAMIAFTPGSVVACKGPLSISVLTLAEKDAKFIINSNKLKVAKVLATLQTVLVDGARGDEV